MAAGFFLALREGLEAALIIGILLGTLRKVKRTEFLGSIWFGAGLAVLVSVLAGLVLNRLSASFAGPAEEIFEGITMLLAAGILTWVIRWTGKQASRLDQKLEVGVQDALVQNTAFGLFSLAFVAVIREGVELAFFLTAASLNAAGLHVMGGAVLGLMAVLAISALLFRGLIKLDLARFFQITSLILVLFAAGLVAHGIHEFNEVGWIPPIIEHVWDINFILDENSTLGELLKALLGYNGNPSLTEVAGYGLYFGLLGLGGFYARRKNPSQGQT